MVGVIGFEPTASCSQSRRSDQAELHPVSAWAAGKVPESVWVSSCKSQLRDYLIYL